MADYRGIDIKEYAENGLADVAGLLSRREYSLSIVRARQIEERLIRSYAAERDIEYTTLADTIEQLYSGGFINMASRDAYLYAFTAIRLCMRQQKVKRMLRMPTIC